MPRAAADAPARKGKAARNASKQAATPADARAARGAHALMDEPPPASTARPQGVAAPEEGERVVLLGNGLAERDVYYSRLETELVAGRLAETLETPVLCYHAGLPGPRRQQSLEIFARSAQVTMVATKAFGMGIDIGDIARVVHWQLPESLSAYVQEVGRAGRDRKTEASALLLQAFGEPPPAADFARMMNLRPDQIRAVLEALDQKQSLPSLRTRFQLSDASLNQLLLPLDEAGALATQGAHYQLRVKLDKQLFQGVMQRLKALRQRRKADLDELKAYVRHRGCRRHYLYKAFDSEPEQAGCQSCDRCRKRPALQ